MSGSISCRERAVALLSAILRREFPAAGQIRAFGEDCPAEFFRDVIEPLADSFDAEQATAYERLMRAWIPEVPAVDSVIPPTVDTVYVLSRVTLGADIKIVSPILAAMKTRFPAARIAFVANRKSAELFSADPAIEWIHADYPRAGSVTQRLEFAHDLRAKLQGENRIVIDPDSRMTQLGLIPVCEPESYFHFPSRTAGGDGSGNLTDLIAAWLQKTFGVTTAAYIAPRREPISGALPRAAVSLGVGDNDLKRVYGDFEAMMIAVLCTKYETVSVDRGVGGEEARRVTAAVEAAGAGDRVHFWEGGFAGFASIISRCDLYAGYDSAGQHAAAAAGVPLVSIFAGAPSSRFRERWTAAGHPKIIRIIAEGMAPRTVLDEFEVAIGKLSIEGKGSE